MNASNASLACQNKWPPCGIVPGFVAVMGIKALLGLIGLLLDLDLIYVTIRNKSLHHTCNVLIAGSAAGSALYQLGGFPSFLIFFNGKNTVSQDVCFWMQAAPLFGKTFSLVMMLAIGLDRLRAVSLGWHFSSSSQKFLYCLFWCAVSSAFGIYFIVISFFDVSPKRNVECSFTSHISQGSSTDIVFYITLVLNLLSPCVYILLGINLLVQHKSMFLYSGAEDQRHAWTRRVYKTIFVIMLIELIGWGSNSLYVWMQHADMVPTALTAWLQTSQYTNWYFNKLYSYIVCVALVANVPALYICSTDYKKAFDRHIKSIQRSLRGNDTTGDTDPTAVGVFTTQLVHSNGLSRTQIHQQKVQPMQKPFSSRRGTFPTRQGNWMAQVG